MTITFIHIYTDKLKSFVFKKCNKSNEIIFIKMFHSTVFKVSKIVVRSKNVQLPSSLSFRGNTKL